MKTQQALAARETAKRFVDAMKEHRMASLCVMQQVGATDAGGFFLGFLDQALDEAGYTMVPMGFCPAGQAPNGSMVMMYSLLIRSKTGKAQSVILG
jgi:hypothetical protein